MRWVLPAITVSLALHGALLGWIGSGDDALPGSEAPVKSTVIVFDSPPALAVSAADGSDNDRTSSAATDGLASTEDPLAPVPVAEPEPEAEPAQVTEADPEPQPVAEAEPEPAAPAQAEAEAAPVAKPVEPDNAAVPVPRVKPPLPDHIVERMAQERAELEAQAQRKEQARREAETRRKKNAEAARRAEQRKAEARRKAEAKRKAKAAIKTNASRAASKRASTGRKGGASAGDKRAYARRVLSHIQRYKRHPGGTPASGVVKLAVRISGSGSLSSARVARSSGNGTLDRAAVATARRASPYPAPPGGSGFSFTVSLRYTR